MTAPNIYARRAWPLLAGVPDLPPGAIVVGLAGELLRVHGDGTAEDLAPGLPRRGYSLDHPARRALRLAREVRHGR
jgi:hypothetical protein